ncbi:cysteine desulfurase family protein [Lachnospiraceae bacterium 54-53]
MIYADNAATTKLDREAFEVMQLYLMEEYGNPSQPYSFSRTSKRALKDSRKTIAECIGALPEEIYFTSGGTESDNWAIKGFFESERRMIITTSIEHHAILNACSTIGKMGMKVKYLPVDSKGTVEIQTLSEAITDDTALVSIMLANNEIGTIEPIAELSEIVHSKGAFFHTDAVQAVGHIPVDVKVLGVDMLSASGHKFNGPRGVGFLYIKKGTPIAALIDGGVQENMLRAGTENVASIVAMAFALHKNCLRMNEIENKLLNLEGLFLEVLNSNAIEYIRNGAEKRIPGNINISIKDASGEMLLHRLDLKGICVSTGSACDSVNTQVSHVINAIEVPADYANGTIRISFGKYNTVEEAVAVAQAIVNILQK